MNHQYHDLLGMKSGEQGGLHDHYFYTQPMGGQVAGAAIMPVAAPSTVSRGGPATQSKHGISDTNSSQVKSKQAKLANFGSVPVPAKEDQLGENAESSEVDAENSEEEDLSPEGDKENDMQNVAVTPNTSFMMHPLAHSTPFLHSNPAASNFMAAAHWNALNLKTEQLAAHYFNTAYAMANHQEFVQVKQEHHQQQYQPASHTYVPFRNSSSSSSSGFHSSSSEGGMPSLLGGMYGQSVPPLHNHLAMNYEPFCTVPGRLTLLSNNKKYRVTMGEVQRRISPPECLNASILGGILRKAKNKDGGKVLRDALKQHGLTLPSGRRKSSATTSFTSLVEEEAMQLAKDFSDISSQNYPFKAAARHALQAVTSRDEEQQLKLELFYARKFVQRISEFHQADRSPLAEQRIPAEMVLDAELQKGLTNYSMLTHGFGGEAIKVALSVLDNCISECGKILDVHSNKNSTVHT